MIPEMYERKRYMVHWFCYFTLKGTEKMLIITKIKMLSPLFYYITCKRKSKLNKKIQKNGAKMHWLIDPNCHRKVLFVVNISAGFCHHYGTASHSTFCGVGILSCGGEVVADILSCWGGCRDSELSW